MEIFTIGGHACTIGGIPVGYGSATPPPPPGLLSLTIGGAPGMLSASAEVPGEGSISWTDGTAQLTGMPYGATVNASLKAGPGYSMHGITHTGISAYGASSMGDGSLYYTGYMTADTLVSASASAMGPKEKTFFIASDSGSCTVSASAYINGTGSPVAVWTAKNGSASASVTLNYGDTVVVVTESNRPTGYSATIYSTGYSTGAPAYTTTGVIVSGTATYAGSKSAMMSAKYKGGQMVITGDYQTVAYYYTNSESSYNGAVNSAQQIWGSYWCPTSATASKTAFAYMSATPPMEWMGQKFSASLCQLALSAFQSLIISARCNVRPTAAGPLDIIEINLVQQTATTGTINYYIADTSFYNGSYSPGTTYNVELSGHVKLGSTAYRYPNFFVDADRDASATVTPPHWGYSGVLK